MKRGRDIRRDGRHYAGAGTSYFQEHRGIAHLPFRRRTLVCTVLTTLLLVGALLLGERYVAAFWGHVLAVIHQAVELQGSVVMSRHTFGGYALFIPYLEVPAGSVSWQVLAISLGACIAVGALSFAVNRERVALRYLLRLVAIVHLTSVFFFWLVPERFPYTLADYMRGMMTASICVIVIVPVVLAFTLYLLDLSWPRKWLATIMIVAYIAVLAPLKYGLQAALLHEGSLLFLPLLYLLAGIPLDVFVFIAMYAWAMSWSRQNREDGMRPLDPPILVRVGSGLGPARTASVRKDRGAIPRRGYRVREYIAPGFRQTV